MNISSGTSAARFTYGIYMTYSFLFFGITHFMSIFAGQIIAITIK
jgi:hypothetical protein